MKSESLDTLLVAQNLFLQANPLCMTEDKYVASSGLVILQDSVELSLLACLIELGVDETKNIENLRFNQLIAELKTAGYRLKKSQSLKAMNKERVNIKHYGYLAEPTTVRNFRDSAQLSISDLIKQVFGKPLEDIVFSDMLKQCEAKDYLSEAFGYFEIKDYLGAAVATRKAIYVEFEADFNIVEWRNYSFDPKDPYRSLILLQGGHKAPSYCRNKKWIEENVRTPFDFIQLDHGALNLELLQYGISTQDYWNLWRLTPKVFRFSKEKGWVVENNPKFLKGLDEHKSKYCLSTAIYMLFKKQQHQGSFMRLADSQLGLVRVRVLKEAPVYIKASKKSKVIGNVKSNQELILLRIFEYGIDGEASFFEITDAVIEEKEIYLFGFIEQKFCKILDCGETITNTSN